MPYLISEELFDAWLALEEAGDDPDAIVELLDISSEDLKTLQGVPLIDEEQEALNLLEEALKRWEGKHSPK